MLQPGTITTLVGPVDAELAALTAALAVSYKTGRALIPGFVPEWPSECHFLAYAGTEIAWKLLSLNIATAARIAPPLLYLRCPRAPLVQERAAKRDPDSRGFWTPVYAADVDAAFAGAKAAGRQLPPLLTIIVDPAAAAGDGDGAMQRLYNEFQGKTVLMAGVETAEPWAADFGPVIELPDLHNSVRWRDLLARITGGDQVVVDQATVDLDVDPLGADEPAVRAALETAVSSGEEPPGALGVLHGYAACFDEWKLVNDRWEGRFLERLSPGAFAKTIAAGWHALKVTFCHGKDPQFGFKSLGPITLLEEDRHGLRYEVALLDDDLNRGLVSGLRAGHYRSSFTYETMAEVLVPNPGPSARNPDGLPELTITEVRLSEFGPCRNPAYKGTSAGLREAS
jgi:HK97 family phage prohead protease